MFMDIVEKYFTGLSERQSEQFQQLEGLYREWNEKINVISRKDIDALNVHHVLHSLAIAKVISFKADKSAGCRNGRRFSRNSVGYYVSGGRFFSGRFYREEN